MFGFDETIEYKKPPIVEFKHALNAMLKLVDSTNNYDAAFVKTFLNEFEHAKALANDLSVTEQANLGAHWQGLLAIVPQLSVYAASGPLAVKMVIPTVRSSLVNCIASAGSNII